MADITFITGNANKAEYLSRYLGFRVKHKSLDLDEIQSLDLREIVTHKVQQAFARVKKHVLVEDVSLEFTALGRLPGPFIKWFLEQMDFESICSLLEGKDRSAVARCVFGYCDREQIKLFEGSLNGKIALHPAGDKGYGWDQIFIPDGYRITRAEMEEEDDKQTYLQVKPFEKVKRFLESLDA